MEEKDIMVDLFSVVGAALSGWSVYLQLSDKDKTANEKRLAVFVKMGPFLEQVQFCKEVHTRFNALEHTTLPEFARLTANLTTIEEMQPLYKWLADVHDAQIHPLLRQRAQMKAEDVARLERSVEAALAQPGITLVAQRLRGTIPELLVGLERYGRVWVLMGNDIGFGKVEKLSADKAELGNLAMQVLNRADSVLCDFVEILTATHASVLAGVRP
jgi:hypothetical protein